MGLGMSAGRAPRRKRRALMVNIGNTSYTLAYFRSPQDADRFGAVLTEILKQSGAFGPGGR